MVQIAVRVPPELVEQLDTIAKMKTDETGLDIDRAQIVRAALREYVKTHSAKAPASPAKKPRRKRA